MGTISAKTGNRTLEQVVYLATSVACFQTDKKS
jgi:hypothetical protein